jgi:hypothetical protein
MAAPSLRDTFAFPLAAACWAAAGTVATGVANLGMTLYRFMGDGAMPELMRDLIPGLVGQGLLAASLVSTLVFVVAERRQARAPARVGHAPGAAAATGLLAAVAAWIAASAVSTLAYSLFTALQSPTGFAVVGMAVSAVHLGAAALGASVGAALLPQAGDVPMPASPGRHGWAGVAVFGAVLAFGLDLVLGALPLLLHEPLGTEVFASAQWSPWVALGVGATAALGYAWRRRVARAPLAWSGDAWAAMACLPITLALAAGFVVVAVVLAYLIGDGNGPALAGLGLGVLGVAGLAFGGVGALAGTLRTRHAPKAG